MLKTDASKKNRQVVIVLVCKLIKYGFAIFNVIVSDNTALIILIVKNNIRCYFQLLYCLILIKAKRNPPFDILNLRISPAKG